MSDKESGHYPCGATELGSFFPVMPHPFAGHAHINPHIHPAPPPHHREFPNHSAFATFAHAGI
ncbi:unnamed protein product [Oikopleura dioica]|uniref:Uncharacterized protein n=1 Tax=Oikopleura dioica TaxID=34765 RepID=E4XWP2_OIKDI|nr:unnamed protein product [Oikopleura dioica]CBY33201.1 unnamed protein product [Oikopleura dioica]